MGSHVAPTRPGFQATPGDADVDLVDLAVAFRRNEAEQILVVEFVCHAREGAAQVFAKADLHVAATGFLGHSGQPGIRQVGQHGRTQAPWPEARHLPLTATPQANGVDHHVLLTGPIDHLGLTRDAPTEIDPAGPGVLAVAEHQHDSPRFVAPVECIHGIVESLPEWCWRIRLDARGNGAQELVAVVREGRADVDVVAERPHARQIVGTQTLEQLLGGVPQQRQIAFHASGHVEQDDNADWLRAIIEQGDRLNRPFVTNPEGVLRQRRDQSTVAPGHGDEYPNDVASASEHRLLRGKRPAGQRQNKGRQQARGPPPPARPFASLLFHSVRMGCHLAMLTERAGPSTPRVGYRKDVRGRLVAFGTIALVVALLCAPPAEGVKAAELKDATIRAFDQYVADAKERFLTRVSTGPRPVAKLPIVVAGLGDGITTVTGGLIHHWAGSVFIQQTTLDRVLDVSRAYGDYQRIYKPILASKVLDEGENHFRVAMRIKEGSGMVTAVLDVVSNVTYQVPQAGMAYAFSVAEDIREVRDAGTGRERRLAPGSDSGYLWRAATFTCYSERETGVMVELENLGLSRSFPPLLGWMIEPIARRLGRKSVEASLREFRDAVLTLSVAASGLRTRSPGWKSIAAAEPEIQQPHEQRIAVAPAGAAGQGKRERGGGQAQ